MVQDFKNGEDALEGNEGDLLARLSSAIVEDDASVIHSLTCKILGDEGDGDEIIPDGLKPQLQKIHCRALIALHKYDRVIDYCSSSSLGEDQKAQEERKALILERSYSLYKLGRYTDCNDVIVKALNNNSIDSNSVSGLELGRGLKHLLAQCHYRIQEMEQATQMYSDLLHDDNDNDAEIMTNALAASVANHSLPCTKTIDDSLEENIMAEIEKDFENKVDTDGEDDDDDEYEYPYELAYNYATYLLQTSTSLSETKQAMELFSKAEKECKAFYEKMQSNEEESDNDDDKEGKESVLKSIAYLKDSMPIQANMALGKMQSGDWSGAMRSYLDLALTSKKGTSEKNAVAFNGGGAIIVAEHNLAVLNSRRGNHSVCDLIKKFPDFSSWMDTRGSSSSHQMITPNQIRIILYNRALLFLKMSKNTEAKAIIQHLRSSLVMATNNDKKNRRQMENKKRKKKKNSSAGSYGDCIAVPLTEAEKMLWECRVSLLEDISNGIVVSKNTDGATKTVVGSIEARLVDMEKQNESSTFERETLEYSLSEVKLYEAQQSVLAKQENGAKACMEEKYIEALEGLPPSIRHRPATVATLCSLYGSLGMNDKAELVLDTSSNGSGSGTIEAKKSMADFKLRLGRYEEAAGIYESIINGDTLSSDEVGLSEEEMMECSAGLVKALSYVDVDRAIDLSQGLMVTIGDDDTSIDGEELEAKEIPRLSKASGVSSRSRKIIASGRETQRKKKNQEAVLRRRAKKREAYLEKLQKEGKYNPDKPSKPDPERWIPKNQRSYNRRGRRGRTKFVGAQGGGTGFGADKDAAKLDVAARAAAKAQGLDLTGGQPSTAHLAVSSAGRRRRV